MNYELNQLNQPVVMRGSRPKSNQYRLRRDNPQQCARLTTHQRGRAKAPLRAPFACGLTLMLDRMKIRIALLLLCSILSSCGYSPLVRWSLERISRQTDPSKLVLGSAYNDYVKRMILKHGTEVGIIQLKDGSWSKYWFRSHHLTHDIGGTVFEMNTGKRFYMAGWFCCEVQLPEKQLDSLAAFTAFINEHHGQGP